MKCISHIITVTALASTACALAENPQFHLKNNYNGLIKVTLYKADGKLLDTVDRTALKDAAIELDHTGKLSSIVIAYGPGYTQKDRFIFDNVTDQTTYYIKFVAGELAAQKGNLLGRTTEGYSLKNNIKDKQIKK